MKFYPDGVHVSTEYTKIQWKPLKWTLDLSSPYPPALCELKFRVTNEQGPWIELEDLTTLTPR